MNRARAGILLAVIAGSGSAWPSATDHAPLLLGNWACEFGNCPDEEVSFALDDGVRVYNSWLHERPSASDGRWQLEGDRLHIDCCAGIGMDWHILRLDRRTLILREDGGEEDAVLRRIE